MFTLALNISVSTFFIINIDMKQATTQIEKFYDAECKKCSHYWLRQDNETCTNENHNIYYGKKHKIGSMYVCDLYDGVE